jgi:hypothetical protein
MKMLIVDLGSRRLHGCVGKFLTLKRTFRFSRRQCRRVSGYSFDGTGPLARLADFSCVVVSDVGWTQGVPEVYAASTFYRLAILFAVFEAVRSKSRIAFSFCLLIFSSVRIRVHDAACDGPNILLNSHGSLLANYNRLTVSESNKVACSWIFKEAFGDVNLR